MPIKQFAKFTAVGLTAYFVGIFTEKYEKSPSFSSLSTFTKLLSENFPGFKIYAAKPSVDSLSLSLNIEDDVEKEKKKLSKDSTDSMGLYGGGNESRTAQIMRFGFPSLGNIRSYDNFVLSYDQRNRIPNWVFEHITKHSIKYNKEIDRSKCEFFEDKSIHPFFRSSNFDYKGSGFDRGHLAAAGNHRLAQSHCEQTFVLSNIAPQVGKGFNRDSWNRLEKHTRTLTKLYTNVYICSGPLYLPQREPNSGKNYVRYQVIGNNNVAVPTHFFKVILGELPDGQLDLESYIMPNSPIDDNAPLSAFFVPVEAVERNAGLLFFDKVNKKYFRQINGRKTSYF